MNLLLLGILMSCLLPISDAVAQQRKAEVQAELLKIMLSIFLGNNDLVNAFEVAKKGTERYPQDPYWWEWYSKIALWLGKSEEAIKARMRLLELRPSEEVLKETLKFAIDTRNYHYAAELISKNPKLAREYKLEDLYFIYINAGEPEKFVSLMDRLYTEERKTEYLYYAARALFEYGQYRQAERYLERIRSERPLRVKEVLLYSDILTAEKRLEENYKLLKSYEDKIAPSSDENTVSYYRHLSSLAWIFKDIQTAARASEILDSLDKAQAEDYVRLYVYYASKGLYEKAVGYAQKGYVKTRDEYLFTLWVEGLSALGDYEGVLKAFELFDSERLSKNAYLSSIYVRAFYRTGQKEKAREVLVRMLGKRPPSFLLSAAIYTAVDFSDTRLMEYILRNFSHMEKELPREFALLYLSRQEGERAKILLDRLKDRDRETLLLYSFVLMSSGRQDEANAIRSMLARELVRSQDLLDNPETLRHYLMSGIGIMPWLLLQDAFRAGKEKLEPRVWQEFYLTNLFVNYFYETAQYARNIHKMQLKPWMELALALRYNDKEKLQRLIKEMDDYLPYRDVAEAKRRLGMRLEALRHAQQSLDKNPKDTLVYEQLRQLAHEHAGELRLGTSYRYIEKVAYQSFDFSLRLNLNERFSLHYGVDGGFLLSDRSPSYQSLPSSYHHHRLALRRHTQRGYWQLGLQAGEGVDSFVGLELMFSGRYRPLDNLSVSLFYNKPAVESLILQLAGLKSGLSVGLFKNLTPRTGLSSTLELSRFTSQRGNSLGTGIYNYTEIYHKLRLGYPDYTFRFFFSFGSYEEKSEKNRRILNLFTFQNPRVLPQDSLTVGLGFNFGINPKEMISRSYYLFLDAEAYYNTEAGAGYGFSAGIFGRLFGRDTFILGVRNFSNFRTIGGTYWEPFTRYRLLF